MFTNNSYRPQRLRWRRRRCVVLGTFSPRRNQRTRVYITTIYSILNMHLLSRSLVRFVAFRKMLLARWRHGFRAPLDCARVESSMRVCALMCRGRGGVVGSGHWLGIRSGMHGASPGCFGGRGVVRYAHIHTCEPARPRGKSVCIYGMPYTGSRVFEQWQQAVAPANDDDGGKRKDSCCWQLPGQRHHNGARIASPSTRNVGRRRRTSVFMPKRM